ncbi:MAG: hypothetical protein L3J79_06750 [Candidatus Marinimicrobia bacterium]|nr:hypothetical protein [Candidatus Neomarinimicrobiota bacterium]
MLETLTLLRRSLGSWRTVANVIVGYSYTMVFRYGWKLHRWLGFKEPCTITLTGRSGKILYRAGGTEWAMAFKCARGPYRFSHVVDVDGFDVTDRIKKFMGPGKNFYGIPTTPNMLGYSKLMFSDYAGNMTYYDGDSTIVL